MQSPMPGFAGLGDGRGTCSMVSRAARKLPSGPRLHSIVPQTATSHPVPRGRAAKEQRRQPSPSATVRTGPGQGEKSVTTAVGLRGPQAPHLIGKSLWQRLPVLSKEAGQGAGRGHLKSGNGQAQTNIQVLHPLGTPAPARSPKLSRKS